MNEKNRFFVNDSILSKYSQEEIILAAIEYLKQKIAWGENPKKVIMDEDSLLLIYDQNRKAP